MLHKVPDFQDFYEDIFEELSKFGELENLNVCDNMADHMVSAHTHMYVYIFQCLGLSLHEKQLVSGLNGYADR